MTAKKNVLLIGLDPAAVDYSGYPGMDAATLWAAITAGESSLNSLGYDAQWCLIDGGEAAEAAVLELLGKEQFDCVLIGAGVRLNAKHFLLFEKLLNAVHEHAPRAKICFNTKPTDVAESVQRWL
jgi:hypothetical protein